MLPTEESATEPPVTGRPPAPCPLRALPYMNELLSNERPQTTMESSLFAPLWAGQQRTGGPPGRVGGRGILSRELYAVVYAVKKSDRTAPDRLAYY